MRGGSVGSCVIELDVVVVVVVVVVIVVVGLSLKVASTLTKKSPTRHHLSSLSWLSSEIVRELD